MTLQFAASSRRTFLKTATAGAAAAAFAGPFALAEPRAKWTRWNVTSPQGQRALATYKRAVEKMIKLPPDDPHNWFRNAFVHLMDCPHGNWWFYVWHRGYLANFEKIIRNVSSDQSFAIPYWDWTALPEIPAPMFADALTPRSPAFLPYNKDLDTFTAYIKAPLNKYWDTLNSDQRAQLDKRGYKSFDNLWNDVDGYDPKTKKVVPGNIGFAANARSRYLTAGNPKLNNRTAFDVSLPTLNFGLAAPDFISTAAEMSFNSSQKSSHNDPAGGTGSFFSTLEGLPHNQIHNYIGGVGPWDPGPYGNMTNFLSPVDPVFFLHHANIDRLWDVWTRKQMKQGQPYLPTGSDWSSYKDEPFLFFVSGDRKYLTNGKAEEYVSMAPFDYDYQPGSGEDVIVSAAPPTLKSAPPIAATVQANSASLSLPKAALRSHLAQPNVSRLAALITLPHPAPDGSEREFDIVVGAPAGITQADPGSPYYAGTISFFGNMVSMPEMEMDSTFVVPLPHNKGLLTSANAAAENVPVSVRVLPSSGKAGSAPVLKSVVVKAR
ncbi:tyrosinase family protein [Occallatibacter riparius]|uniref:Tyrosinase family protein n=1 Tax=Occallatibacter riparius TaxID=1002689 RepID=A0A9J7BGS2_9BACT|nr:tyrosinase family protein [Occallatibacter riparius]UWZ81943.1 tyrosinase family protein [Occallatibacter riparius]